jgi:hypothetical protein
MEEIVEQGKGRNFDAMISGTLVRSSTTHESLDVGRFESSLSQEQSSVYGKLRPLILDQLFVPIGEPREIRRVAR